MVRFAYVALALGWMALFLLVFLGRRSGCHDPGEACAPEPIRGDPPATAAGAIARYPAGSVRQEDADPGGHSMSVRLAP